MPSNSAEYQRAYRARQRARREAAEEPADPPLARPCARCLALEEEVRHLKAELAKRPAISIEVKQRPPVWLDDEDYSQRPVRAVPKVRSTAGRSR